MENITYRKKRKGFFGSPKILFHPVTAYLIGFLAYHLFPPFFSEQGHNWFIILLDLFAIVFFAVGVANGRILKRIFFGLSFKIKAGPEDFKLMLLIWFCLLFSLRVFHYYEAGIYSLLHPYSTQCHIYTTMKGQLTSPFIILLWYGVVVLKKKYCYLLLFLEFLISFPILSRSFIFMFFLYGIAVYAFVNGLSRKKLKQFTMILLVLFMSLGIIGGCIHAVRSYVYIGELDKIASIQFSDHIGIKKGARFLSRRMNIHGNYKLIEGYEEYIADLDIEGLKSILPKLLGFEKEYKVRPTSAAGIAGRRIGFIKGKTATELPRNIILFHTHGGILTIAMFYLIFGALFGLLFEVLYSAKNMLFPIIYFVLLMGHLAGGTGSLIGATAFQVLFSLITFSIPLSIFYTLKMSKNSMFAIVR